MVGSRPHLQLETLKVQAEASHEIKAPKPQPRESVQSSGCCCLQPCWPEQRGAGPLSICLKETKDRLAAFTIPCGWPLPDPSPFPGASHYPQPLGCPWALSGLHSVLAEMGTTITVKTPRPGMTGEPHTFWVSMATQITLSPSLLPPQQPEGTAKTNHTVCLPPS